MFNMDEIVHLSSSLEQKETKFQLFNSLLSLIGPRRQFRPKIFLKYSLAKANEKCEKQSL